MLLATSLLVIASCGTGGDRDGGEDPTDSGGIRDSAALSVAIGRTCSRLGLAFTQTDVAFLLDELSAAIAGTGYSDGEAIDALRTTCPAKVNYANALP